MGEVIPSYEKIYNSINKITNLIIINVLWIVFCIPLITIGAATTAMYTVTFKMADGIEGSHISKDFFKAFKENFNCATKVWVVSMVIGVVLSVNVYMVNTYAAPNKKIMLFFLFLLILVFCTFEIYIYPIIAIFKDDLKTELKNALFMSLANLPSSALILCMTIIPLILMAFFAEEVLVIVMFYLVIGYSYAAYTNTKLFKRIFKKYVK